MRSLLRDPRWLAGLAVAVVFAVACVSLAQWQLDRRVQRAERNAAVLENYDSAPRPLPEVLDRAGPDALTAPLGPSRQWLPVLLQGRYDDDATVLVRNRPQDGGNGYLVATPFTTSRAAAGTPTTLLLVRGWVPSGQDASSPGAVPPAPDGPVEVLARLRDAESAATRGAPAGQTYRLDAATLGAGAAGPALTGAYGVVAEEDGARPAGLAPVPRPDTDPGPHLSYGVQWYLFALAGLGIWLVLARRHARELAALRAERAARDVDRADGPGAGGAAAAGAHEWVYEPGR